VKWRLALASKPTSIIIIIIIIIIIVVVVVVIIIVIIISITIIIITIDAVACRSLNKGKGKVFRDACRHCRPSASRMLLSSKHCLLRMNSSGSISDCDKEVLLLWQSQNLLINTLAALGSQSSRNGSADNRMPGSYAGYTIYDILHSVFACKIMISMPAWYQLLHFVEPWDIAS